MKMEKTKKAYELFGIKKAPFINGIKIKRLLNTDIDDATRIKIIKTYVRS